MKFESEEQPKELVRGEGFPLPTRCEGIDASLTSAFKAWSGLHVAAGLIFCGAVPRSATAHPVHRFSGRCPCETWKRPSRAVLWSCHAVLVPCCGRFVLWSCCAVGEADFAGVGEADLVGFEKSALMQPFI